MGKLAGVIVAFMLVAISIIGLVYTAEWAFGASQRADEAKKNLAAANENLAQSYADMPWTMEHITQDINSCVASGQYDRATGDWLIQRVQEIRTP